MVFWGVLEEIADQHGIARRTLYRIDEQIVKAESLRFEHLVVYFLRVN